MRVLLVTGILLALSTPLRAETYSWIDSSGTFHFTEDYSRIPKKYRNRVNRRDDMSSEETNTTAAKPAGKAEAKGENGPARYGGKTEEQWRSELNSLAGEINRLKGVMDDLEKQMQSQKVFTKTRANQLKQEYDEARDAFDQKRATYNGLVQEARKSGLTATVKQ